MKKMIMAAIMAVVFSASPLLAGDDSQSRESGFFGVFFPRITFRGDNQPDTGNGAGVRLGGIVGGDIYSTYLSVFRTSHDEGLSRNAVFTGITWDVKLSLPLSRILSPYVLAGLGRYVLENSQTVLRGNQDGSGVNGYQVGAGFDFRLSELFTLNAGYTKRRMEFDTGTPGGNEIRRQARTYDIGLAVHFQ